MSAALSIDTTLCESIQAYLFLTLKEIGGEKKVCKRVLKNESDDKLTTEERKKYRLKQHSDRVIYCDEHLVLNYWNNLSIQESPIDTSPFILEEILDARKTLKNDKLYGEDFITSEMVKKLEENGVVVFQLLFNKLLEN